MITVHLYGTVPSTSLLSEAQRIRVWVIFAGITGQARAVSSLAV
jgi:hypothetical protein